MKLILFLVFVVSFINLTKSQSSEENLSGCGIDSNRNLRCNNFQYSYLPCTEEFKQATSIIVNGNYSELTIDPRYIEVVLIEIHSSNLQNFQLQDYTSFTELAFLSVGGSSQVLNVDFSGAGKLPPMMLKKQVL